VDIFVIFNIYEGKGSQKASNLKIYLAGSIEQNTMYRLAQGKGVYLGGTGTVGSGFWEINKVYSYYLI
jgi:hypothetical protein